MNFRIFYWSPRRGQFVEQLNPETIQQCHAFYGDKLMGIAICYAVLKESK